MKKEPCARQACAIFMYMNAMFSIAMTQGFSDCACSTSNALRIPCKNTFSQNFEDCLQAGCCFDRTFFFFGNRCFEKNERLCHSVTQQCNIPPQQRIACGMILNPFLCEINGCCFDATTVFSVPQCYIQGTFATSNTPFNIIPTTPFPNTPTVTAFKPGVSEWSQWSSCPDHCELTYSIRRRTCMAQTEQDCANVGLHTEEQMECLNTCRNWSNWSFGMCSATCEQGTMIRTRTCIGKAFTGPTSCNRGERQCMLTACPVSLWGTWLPWSECSNSCSSGERKRTRMCYDQFDRTTEVENCAHSFAARPDQQTQPCNENLCQNWSPWSSLSECSKTCGNSAYRYAFRECSKLSTGLLGTAQYEACRQLTVICSLPPCPVTFATIIPFNIHKTTKLTVVTSTSQPKRINLYNWQTWLSWSACSNQCRPGNRVRVRKCLDRNGLIESPGNCGNQKSLDEERCNTNLCSKWGSWIIGSCSISCINIDGNSLGTYKSTRICQGKAKSRAPDQCHSRVRTCQVTRLCPEAATIRTPPSSTESQFTKAVTTTVFTTQTTTSSTTMSTIQTTTPSTTMSTTVATTKEPPTASIWDNWGEWSTCSSTCAPGIQTRARECLPNVPIPLCNTGALVDSRTCNKAFCQEWSAWKTGGCDKTCGDGVTVKERQCVSGHSLRNVSKTCYMSVDSCNSEPCGIVDTSPKPKVADSKRDILFLIDSSKYVDNCAEIQETKGWKKPLNGKQVNEETTPNYSRIKKFISDFVSGWNGVSDSGSRISIQLFSNLCSPKTKFNLHMQKKFNDSHDDFVANYVENMPYFCGDFWLSWALQCSVTPVFTTAYGDRKTVPNLVVAVISNAPTTSQPSARLLKFVLKKLALKKTTVISVAATHFDELSASARKRYEENLRLLSCPLKNKNGTKCSNYIGSIWNKEASNPAELIRQALKSIDKS